MGAQTYNTYVWLRVGFYTPGRHERVLKVVTYLQSHKNQYKIRKWIVSQVRKNSFEFLSTERDANTWIQLNYSKESFSLIKKNSTTNYLLFLWVLFAVEGISYLEFKVAQRLGLVSLVHEAALNITKDLSSLKRKRLTFIQGICASALFSAGHWTQGFVNAREDPIIKSECQRIVYGLRRWDLFVFHIQKYLNST